MNYNFYRSVVFMQSSNRDKINNVKIRDMIISHECACLFIRLLKYVETISFKLPLDNKLTTIVRELRESVNYPGRV